MTLRASRTRTRSRSCSGSTASTLISSSGREAADLFAGNGTIEVGRSGVYVGKERVLELTLRSQGPEFPQAGRLFDQMQLQPIVHVAPDGLTAKGRWHMFAQEAVHGEYANWGLGVYRKRVRQRGRRLEDPIAAPLHHDVHAV